MHLHSSIQLPPGTCVARGVMIKRRPPGLLLAPRDEVCYMSPGVSMPVGFRVSPQNHLLSQFTHSLTEGSGIANKHELHHNTFQEQLFVLRLPSHISLPSEADLSEAWTVINDIEDDDHDDDSEEDNKSQNVLQHIPPKYVKGSNGLKPGYVVLRCDSPKLPKSGQENLTAILPSGVACVMKVCMASSFTYDHHYYHHNHHHQYYNFNCCRHHL